MTNHGKSTLLAMLLIPGAAFAQISVGDNFGVTETAIQSALQAKGYDVTEIEVEGDDIEVEAAKNGQSFEFYVSSETGLVLLVEDEDEDEDRDDDEDEDDEDGDDD